MLLYIMIGTALIAFIVLVLVLWTGLKDLNDKNNGYRIKPDGKINTPAKPHSEASNQTGNEAGNEAEK